MIGLQVADLVLVASRVLDIDTDAALDLLDVDATETALAAAASPEPLGLGDPAGPAAALLSALLRHRPLRHGNEQVALVATAQFLALNGFTVDLDPPEQARSVVDDVAAGRLETAELAEWLAVRVRLHDDAAMHCGNESFLRRWLPSRRRPGTRGDPFRRFTDRARMVVVLAQDEARRLGNTYVGTEHLLLGLIGMGDGVAAKALEVMGITGDAVRHRIEEVIGCGRGHRAATSRSRRGRTEPCSSVRCGRRGSSVTTTSAPSTCCSACSARAGAGRRGAGRSRCESRRRPPAADAAAGRPSGQPTATGPARPAPL